MSEHSEHEELIAWLREEGYGAEEIEKILAKVARYDNETMHDSIMDSIASGSFDLDSIIKEALGEE